MWGVILALQSSGAVHLGVDNLGVVRHVGRLLDGCHGTVPFELVHNNNLLLLIDRMLHLGGLRTVRITKVKGHADESMVLENLGVVRHIGRLLDGRHGPTPVELVKDGDLLLLIERMLRLRGLTTARVTKVKGHADEGMVF